MEDIPIPEEVLILLAIQRGVQGRYSMAYRQYAKLRDLKNTRNRGMIRQHGLSKMNIEINQSSSLLLLSMFCHKLRVSSQTDPQFHHPDRLRLQALDTCPSICSRSTRRPFCCSFNFFFR